MSKKDIFNMAVGKNCSFKAKNFNHVVNYMNKTKRSFSQTLNFIIEEWHEFGTVMRQYQKQQEFEKLTEAKIINPMNEKSKVEMKK